MTMTLDAVPQDIEAERAVLGALLVNPDQYAVVTATLGPADFCRQVHGDIFAAMQRMFERQEPVDYLTLKKELHRAGRLEDAGGDAYLLHLADGVPRSTNALHYSRIVRQTAAARRAMEILRTTATSIAQNPWALGNGLPQHHREAWDRVVERATADDGLSEDDLADAVDVAAEGQRIEEEGIPQLVDGLIPYLGMLGFLVA